MEFYRYMCSPEKAKQFVKEKGTLTSIKGSSDAEVPPFLEGAATAYKAAKTIWSTEYIQWYPAMGKETQDALSAL